MAEHPLYAQAPIIEYINGMEVVKVFNRESESYENFRKDVTDYRDYTLAWYKACLLYTSGKSGRAAFGKRLECKPDRNAGWIFKTKQFCGCVQKEIWSNT